MSKRSSHVALDGDTMECSSAQVQCRPESLPVTVGISGERKRHADDDESPSRKLTSAHHEERFSLEELRRILCAQLEALEARLRQEYSCRLITAQEQQYGDFMRWQRDHTDSVTTAMNYLS